MKTHNTGKVQIGLTYQPKPRKMTEEEIFFQKILLGKTPWEIDSQRQDREDKIIFLTMIGAMFAVGLMALIGWL